MDIFNSCKEINKLLASSKKGAEESARVELIKLLDFCQNKNYEYDPLINHLIRQLGLYPYIKTETSSWHEKIVYEAFKVNVGDGDENRKTLHREQSAILKRLLNDENLAVIAPTSFGKSFIIDAFISIKNPNNILIIVPTIALMDETRRRLQQKFSTDYKVITASEITLGEKNIFIFPQERALHYIKLIDSLDMLVIDEFYKASADFDENRSTSLLHAILEFSKKSKQKYFIAPHITNIKDNPFMDDMEDPVYVDFNTVYLNKHHIYNDFKGMRKKDKEEPKKNKLLEILNKNQDETLIYAGSYSQIKVISELLMQETDDKNNPTLDQFSIWLAKNYYHSWTLVNMVKKGIGIHNGRLHRSLGQIQIKLFNKEDGIINLISTSSIIEGVNTSAKNIVVWSNKISNKSIDLFGYQNLIGRGGRMFKHFIGEIYLLESPPEDKSDQIELSLEMPKELVDESSTIDDGSALQTEVDDFHQHMRNKLGHDSYNRLRKQGIFKENNWDHIRALVDDMKGKPKSWNGLSHLSTNKTENWKRHLFKVLNLANINPPGELVVFIQKTSNNWNSSIPVLIDQLKIDVEKYFELEKKMSFEVYNLFSLVNILQKEIFPENKWDISPFVSKIRYTFLPKNVYLLEEYGLPRMISKKIQKSKIVDLENNNLELNNVIDSLSQIGYEDIISKVGTFDDFDNYLLKYFFKGIQ